MDKLSFLSKNVELSEQSSSDNLTAKFCLCDFSVNGNGVQLNRDKIDNWVSTLVNQPLVGRVGYNGDFTGHNMRVGTYVDAQGNECEDVMFDTEAIGTFTSVGVETMDDVDCIVGSAEIWSRYPTVCELIKKRVADGDLHTSWEILVSESHMDGNVKVIDDGRFTALCVLGKNVAPAFESSRLLEVAEDYSDVEMADALTHDISVCEEDKKMHDEKIVSEEVQAEVEQTEEIAEEAKEAVAEQEPEVSEDKKPEDEEDPAAPADDEEDEEKEQAACGDKDKEHAELDAEIAEMTMWDIRREVEKAIGKDGHYAWVEYLFPESHLAWAKDCGPESEGDLNYMQYEYTVNGNEVTVGEPTPIELVASPRQINQMFAEKNAAIADAAAKIAELEAEVSELRPYKEVAEKAAAEKAEVEKAEKISALKAYALKSNFISAEEMESDESIKTMISELNEAGIKQVIAERYMASANEPKAEKPVEVSTKHIEVSAVKNLYDGDGDAEVDFLSAYLKKKN